MNISNCREKGFAKKESYKHEGYKSKARSERINKRIEKMIYSCMKEREEKEKIKLERDIIKRRY